MANPVCPETGAPMHRDVRPMTLTYKGESLTFDMPGWYCNQSKESIHTGEDMKVSDRMLNRLKARSQGLARELITSRSRRNSNSRKPHEYKG
jgi:HTH-type transcriptional regulator / antitoxin MqsA